MNQENIGMQAAEPVAIIGYGTAGVNAIIGLRTSGYTGPIRVFTDGGALPYSPVLTSYYAGGLIEFDECFPWSAEMLDQMDVEVHAGCPVDLLDPVEHAIHTAEGVFSYSKCVVASGASPNCVGFPEVEGWSDYKPLVLRTIEDAKRLRETLDSPACRRVLVSGASMIALKTVAACLNRGVDVTLVGMNDHVLDYNAIPETAIRFEKGLRKNGVNLMLGQTISSVKRVDAGSGEAGEGKLEVTFSTGAVDCFDEIAVAHGVRSNLGFIKDGTLETGAALLVDEYMRTSNPDVYAAGDVAQALEITSGERQIVGIWKSAALQGACAGRAIAALLTGKDISEAGAYEGAMMTNKIVVKETLFMSAGRVLQPGEGRIELRERDDMTVATFYVPRHDGTEKLVGFNITADKDEEGGIVHDIAAILTMRIEEACAS